MRDPDPKQRRMIAWEIAIFAALLVAVTLRNAFTDLSNYAGFGDHLALWEPFVWEISSNLLIAALIPAIAWLNRRLPIADRYWYRSVPVHLVATLPFSIVHVAGMVGLRKLAYALAGGSYHFGPIVSGWVYEYRKDFVAYWIIIGILCAFGVWRRWREAQETIRQTAPQVPRNSTGPLDRLVVRKLNREFILDVANVVRIESDGNYVTIHANGTTYRLRASLAGLSKRLDGQRFVRIHRGQIVNVDYIREIQPWYHGDYRVLLKDGNFVNFSRRYRGRLTNLFNPLVEGRPQGSARP